MLTVTSPQDCEYRRKPANKLTLKKMNNKKFTFTDYKAFIFAITLFIILQGLTSCSKETCPQAYNKSTAQFNHNYAKR